MQDNLNLSKDHNQRRSLRLGLRLLADVMGSVHSFRLAGSVHLHKMIATRSKDAAGLTGVILIVV